MNSDALITDWDVPWIVTTALAVTAIVYIRGWKQIRQTRPDMFPPWRLWAFLSGILAVFIAVASPLDTFAETLLCMHMGQHFVLMTVAPPLIVLGAPVVPMLRGLPRWVVRKPLRPLFQSGVVHGLGKFLTEPRVAWLAMNAAYVLWHIPKAYEFALSSENWHNVEHACFFFTSLMFWWPVIAPWPYKQTWSRWFLLPYLLLADLVNTGLSAFLCFSGKLLYPSYGQVPRPFGFPALNDQIAAGAFMWVAGSPIFLIAAMKITMTLLSPRRQRMSDAQVALLHR